MTESLLSPSEIEPASQHRPSDDICHDETPPSLWQRLWQMGNREVFTSLSGVLTFLCLILAFQILAGILVVYASVTGAVNDSPDPTVSTQYADTCVRALTETLAKERSAHQIR